MKKFLIVFIFLFLFPFFSAASINMNEEFSSGETLIANINGNFIPEGYRLGNDPISSQRMIRFENKLKNDDIGEVIVRKDLKLISSFNQSQKEKMALIA